MSLDYIEFFDTPNNFVNNKCKSFEIIEKPDPLSFLPVLFKNLDVSIVSALKRIFTSELDTVAFAPSPASIDDGEYHEEINDQPIDDDDEIDQMTGDIKILFNKSQYHREVLIDRIGFITLNYDFISTQQMNVAKMRFIISDPDDINQPFENNTQVIIKISVHKNVKFIYDGSDMDIKNICPYDSLLLTLKPKEKIHIEMMPSHGNGRQHPRWQSSVTLFKYATQFDLDHSDHIETNDEQMKYIGHESKNPEKIIVVIESIGKMSSINVLKKGITELNNKLIHIRSELINQQPTKINIDINDKTPNFMTIKLLDEDHTLGNVLEYIGLVQLENIVELLGHVRRGAVMDITASLPFACARPAVR